MSSGDYLDALASERSHSAKLTKIIFGIVGLAVAGMWFASRVPKNIDLHVAPDIKAGDTIRVIDGQSPVPSTNAYGFAYYIWQQINRWQSDGSQDYGKQIYAMQFYLTPRCQAQLQTDMQQRHAKGELRRRTRQISEIPGFPYSENRVIREGSDAWTVLLDMQVQETFAGQPVISEIGRAFPVTIRLALMAFVFEAIFGVIFGIISGLKKGKWYDSVILVLSLLLISVPFAAIWSV